MTEVETRSEGDILVITLNRPHARNAVDAALARGIADALDGLDADPGLRVGIVTGAAGTFCSGMDLAAFARGEVPRIPGRGFAGITRRSAAKPLIAAVEGYAVAGGFEIALACDLIVASDTARFGLPEVRRGLTPAAGGAFRLPRRIPFHVAMELLLTGDLFGAERAHALGLVSRLTAPGCALEQAMELARVIAANAPLSVRAVKEIVSAAPGWPPGEEFDHQESIAAAVAASEDAREGSRAFVEKRAPVWRGR